MAMLVGEMGANYFITVFEHLAALRKKKKKKIPNSSPYVRMLGMKTVEQQAQKDECLSRHMAVPPESRGIMAESVQCFTLETACHQCQSL